MLMHNHEDQHLGQSVFELGTELKIPTSPVVQSIVKMATN